MVIAMAVVMPLASHATDYYVATTGSDANNGDKATPFATLGKAITVAKAGDNVYIQAGTYRVSEAEIMSETSYGPYKRVYDFGTSGSEGKPICFIGLSDDSGNRPVFDFTDVNPSGYRVTGFYVHSNYLLFRNMELVGVQVNITSHTQSENIRLENASHCTFDNIAMHSGRGIGIYLAKNSGYNLIVNCDAYENYDDVSESGSGGNNDGFGCHVSNGKAVGNVFIGCRAWANSDDGFDLINCWTATEMAYCFAYKNGYSIDNGKYVRRADGNGFKAGGWGMSKADVSLPSDGAPVHQIHHNVAVANGSVGIYSNHNLGGVHFYDNISAANRYNYSFVNRKGAGKDEATDVNGYDHIIERNLDYKSTISSPVWIDGEDEQNTISGNSFVWDSDAKAWSNTEVNSFGTTSEANFLSQRDADGYLAYKTYRFYTLKNQDDATFGFWFDINAYKQAIADAKATTGAEAVSGATGIDETRLSTPNIQHNADDATYNLNGQRIGKGYRGIVIRGGKKYIQK